MNGDGEVPLGDDERDALVSSLLRDHPTAIVAALGPYGRLVDLPDSIALSGQHVVSAGSPFQLIGPGSRAAIIANRRRVAEVGAASTRVVLVDGSEGWCHVVDVRRRHGTLVGMIVADTAVDLVAQLTEQTALAPRTGRMQRDESGIILEVDDDMCAMLGRSAEELIGTVTIDLVHPDDHAPAIDAWIGMLMAPGMVTRARTRFRRADGTWRWMAVTNINRLDQPEGRVVSQLVDISDEVDALEALRLQEQLLRRLAESLPSGVLRIDRTGGVVYGNARLRVLTGIDDATSVAEQFAAVVTDDRGALDAAIGAALRDGADAHVEARLRMPHSPRIHLCAIAVRALTDADGKPDGAVLSVDDVTEAAELRAELERRATVDDLTGCLNRASVLTELDRVLRTHAAGSSGTAVVFLDLDGFKGINDTYGHQAGDQVLASIVTRINAVLRRQDLIGRLGGDEFLIVLPTVASLDEATAIGQRLTNAVGDPPEIVDGQAHRIRCSIGVAWASSADVTADTLTTAADEAMYASKRIGDSQPVYVAVGP